MNPKQYDLEISNEIIRSQESGELTDEIKEFFIEFIWNTSELKKYSSLNEEDLKLCESFAFKTCCDMVLTLDVEIYNLFQYFNQLIKTSYSTTIQRILITSKQTEEYEIQNA